MPEPPASLRIYQRLIRLYPASFRDEYAGELERQFRDELADAAGPASRAFLWLRLLFDLAISVPAQLAREIAQDSRHALRQWARRPLNTAFAIAALAIGIGANTGMFSVVDALLLRPLPFRDADRLVGLYLFQPPHDTASRFEGWRKNSSYLEDAALLHARYVNLEEGREAVRVSLAATSSNFFTFLGTPPIAGRGFTADENQPGKNNVVVINYGLWEGLFGGDPKAVGASLRIDGEPVTIIGIAPPDFDFPRGAALWRPANFSAADNGWSTVARLKPGISVAQARIPFLAEADRLDPNRPKAAKLARPSVIAPLQAGLASTFEAPPHSPPSARTGSLILLWGATLILLIACTNVANLLLARTAERAGELSVRSAMGAGRARLTQQLLTECMLLSSAAATAGLLVANSVTSIASKVQSPPAGAPTYSIWDARVIGFTVAISILCGVLFGVLPSLYASRVPAFAGRGTNFRAASRRARELLIAAQVSLTLVLLASALVMNQAFLAFEGMDRGFDRQGIVTVSVSVTGSTHSKGGARLAYIEDVLERVRAIPGVRTASTTEFLPLAPNTGFLGGRLPFDGRRPNQNAMIVPVMPGYLETMGGHLIAGRDFTDADLRMGMPVAIVNDLYAREFGNPAEMVGHRAGSWPIVGVFKGMVYLGDYNHAQVLVVDPTGRNFPVTIVARVEGPPANRLAVIRDAVKSADPSVPVFDVKTMDQRLDEALVRPKFYSTAANFFAGFALLLAVIGIYGVVSFSVAQRGHELGVRLALGTTPVHLRTALLRQALVTVAIGSGAGIFGALLGGKFLESLIDGAKPIGMEVCVGAALLIALSAAAAVWSATRGIARLDVMEVLRAE